jgi:hypothetical protein
MAIFDLIGKFDNIFRECSWEENNEDYDKEMEEKWIMGKPALPW